MPSACLTLFFFFSSRRRHTRSTRDWSSDVCSSDLRQEALNLPAKQAQKSIETANQVRQLKQVVDRATGEEGKQLDAAIRDYRSEERRVGKECRSRWWAAHKKKKAKQETSKV